MCVLPGCIPEVRGAVGLGGGWLSDAAGVHKCAYCRFVQPTSRERTMLPKCTRKMPVWRDGGSGAGVTSGREPPGWAWISRAVPG